MSEEEGTADYSPDMTRDMVQEFRGILFFLPLGGGTRSSCTMTGGRRYPSVSFRIDMGLELALLSGWQREG
jgi:hypothetical protein